MGILDVFKKKKEVRLPESYVPREPLPSDLERFRSPAREIPTPTATYPEFPRTPIPPTPAAALPPGPTAPADKLDLILEKLETIDTRLKLIEEKLS